MKTLLALAVVSAGLGYAADLGHGIQLYQQGKFKEAESELAAAASADPHSAKAYRYLALSRIEQRKLSEAQDALNHANELEPNGETKAVWARLYTEQKNYDKAEQSLAGASGVEADYAKGRLELARGRNDAAAKAFESYLENSPDSAYGHYYAGMAYNGAKRPDKMLTQFELFVRMRPDAPEAKKVRAVLQTGR